MKKLVLIVSWSLFSGSLVAQPPEERFPFILGPLPYAYNALEPFIDTETMQLHHDKHHQKYVDELNSALKKHPELHKMSLVDLVKQWPSLSEDIRNAVRNNAGGNLNHSLFWKWMTPRKTQPAGKLLAQINRTFGTLDAFKTQFMEAAKKVFGSGWAWLCLDGDGNLTIVTTPNQDNPLTNGLFPILGLDVWEHAYYLKYHNKRPDYLDAWWHIVNWPEAERLHAQFVPLKSDECSEK